MVPANTVLQNRYRVVRQLGSGGMGTVYEAVDQRLSSIVAIKETLIATEEGRRAFEREASLLANLRHRSLPSVTDHFPEGEGQFLVMQFIPGEDLAQLLELRRRAFSAAQVVAWAEDILGALEYLHSHNPPILHRDIKPANLKLTREGELFLIDFGLSKGSAGQMPTLVTSRSVKGYTPAYAPLEQIHGGGTDPRSDLYSVGATLYHLLTYVAPVDAPKRFNALDDLQPDPMPPADQINPDVPHELAQVLIQAMAMNRRNRPASALDMRRLLREALPRQAEDAVTVQKKFVRPSPAAATASSREDAVTMRKEAASVAPPVAPSAPAVLRPTEPAAITHPLPRTRSTDSLDLPSAPTPVPPAPTIGETPNLIDRHVQMPVTQVLSAAPESAGPSSQPDPFRGRRGISRPLVFVLASLPILLILGLASVFVARWFINRKAVENVPIQSASTTPDHPVTQTKAADVPTGRFFTGDFNVGKALELIYGSYDYQKKYAKWKLTDEDLRKSHLDTQGSGITAGTVYTNANFFQSFTQAGVQRYFLVTETVPARYDCHACAPMIGGAVFSQVGNNWQLEAENKIISTLGSFGSAPKGKLVKIGPDRQGAMFEAGGMGQGISSEVAVLIADLGETLREVLTVDEFGGDNGGACGEGLATCYSFSSKLDFVPGASPEYYDARVTTTGTKEDKDGNVRRVNAVKKYTFANGKYMPAK